MRAAQSTDILLTKTVHAEMVHLKVFGASSLARPFPEALAANVGSETKRGPV